MYRLKIILRYLRARRITVIPILAVAVAVFLLIVVLAVMNGFSSFIQGKLRGTLSDVIVDYDDVRGFGDYEDLRAKLAAIPGVKAISPHLSRIAVLTVYAGKGAGRPYDFSCLCVGVNLDAENEVSHLDRALLEPKRGFRWDEPGEPLPGLILGNEVLGRYYVRPGYNASLTTLTATDEDSSLKFRITDHFKTGLYEYDRTTVYVPLAAAQKLMRLEGRITSFHLRAGPDADVDHLKAAVCRALPADPRFIVKTWMESQKVLIDAMRLERVIWVVVISALLAVAGFCILAVMSLTVIQKTRDIGILRSIGAGIMGVLSTFLQYGLVVGLIGSTLGLAVGFIALHYLDPIEGCLLSGGVAVFLLWLAGVAAGFAVIARLTRRGKWRLLAGAATFVLWTRFVWLLGGFHYLDGLVAFGRQWLSWTPWPRDVFYFESIPREIDWHAMLTFWAWGIVVSLVASIVPAVRAARTNPVETLRHEH